MLSSTDLGLGKREGRSRSLDKRHGRSRSPSTYLKKKGKRLSDFLSVASLKTLVPKRNNEFVGSNSIGSPKRTASISSFTSFTSPDVLEATPIKDEFNECPQLVDILQDVSTDEDQPTEVSTVDESCIYQPSDAIPADETPVVLIALAEIGSSTASLNGSGAKSTSDAQVNDSVEDHLQHIHEKRAPEMQSMKSSDAVNEETTKNTSSNKELITESMTNVLAESQPSDISKLLPEVAEDVLIMPTSKSAHEIDITTSPEGIMLSDLMKAASVNNEAGADYNIQNPRNDQKGSHRLVLKIFLLLLAISVAVALWMVLKNFAWGSELSKSDTDHDVLPQLKDVNPRSGKDSFLSLHRLLSTAKKSVHSVFSLGKKNYIISLDQKHLSESKKSLSFEDTIDLGEKLQIRTLIARVPHFIDSFKFGTVGK